ncbi:MAG: VanZ family protein [Rhizomicrobium sp.]
MSLRQLLHRFRKLDAWLLVPAVLVVVYGELAHSTPISELEGLVWDKALHFTAYFGLALMATIAVRADRRALWAAVGLIVLGGGLEIVQGVTGRDADVWDETANTLGVLCGAGLAWAGIAFLRARQLVDGKGPD